MRQSRTYGAWLWPVPSRCDPARLFICEELGIATFDRGELADAAADNTAHLGLTFFVPSFLDGVLSRALAERSPSHASDMAGTLWRGY